MTKYFEVFQVFHGTHASGMGYTTSEQIAEKIEGSGEQNALEVFLGIVVNPTGRTDRKRVVYTDGKREFIVNKLSSARLAEIEDLLQWRQDMRASVVSNPL